MAASKYAVLLARERINVRNSAELELWTEVLDIYVGDIVLAVGEVGNVSADVLDYLLTRELEGNRSRTPAPAPRTPRETQ